jgi:hypothetical protein
MPTNLGEGLTVIVTCQFCHVRALIFTGGSEAYSGS